MARNVVFTPPLVQENMNRTLGSTVVVRNRVGKEWVRDRRVTLEGLSKNVMTTDGISKAKLVTPYVGGVCKGLCKKNVGVNSW